MACWPSRCRREPHDRMLRWPERPGTRASKPMQAPPKLPKILGLTFAVGLAGLLALIMKASYPPVSPARLMVGEAQAVRLALEQWHTDHAGRYPSDHDFPAAITRGSYLPGQRARNWYEEPPGPTLLVGSPAAALPLGTAAPPGLRAGTILYHRDPGGRRYALAFVARQAEGLVVRPVPADE